MIFNDYFEKNVRNQRESREYAQQIVRVDKSTRLSIYNQLLQIWNELNVEFQRDIDESTIKIIMNSFIKQLNDRKNIWWKFVVVKNKIIVTFRVDNQKKKNRQKNIDERNQRTSLNTINVNAKSRDDYQNYQDNEYNQFNFFRFEFNFELQSTYISTQFQNFVLQSQFQFYFQNRVYYSQQQQSSSQFNQFSNEQQQQSILSTSTQRKQIIDSIDQNAQSNALNFNQRFYRQYNNRQRFVDKIFHVATRKENISKTDENSFVDFYEINDYYDDDDYYDDTSNDVDFDEITNESTEENSMIFFLKIFIVQRHCAHCKTEFFFNNKLHRHLR